MAIVCTVTEKSVRTSAMLQIESMATAGTGAIEVFDKPEALTTLMSFIVDEENDADAVGACLRTLAFAANRSEAVCSWLVSGSLPGLEFPPLACLVSGLFARSAQIQFAALCV